MFDNRNRSARALHSELVAVMDKFVDLVLPWRFAPLGSPPPGANHLDTRMVRENSFLDVLVFFGPVSFTLLSDDRKFSPSSSDMEEWSWCNDDWLETILWRDLSIESLDLLMSKYSFPIKDAFKFLTVTENAAASVVIAMTV